MAAASLKVGAFISFENLLSTESRVGVGVFLSNAYASRCLVPLLFVVHSRFY